jgi:hypothetical protein
MESVEVTLPTGFAVDGQWRRRAGLRPVNGRDEELLREKGSMLLPAERTTALLARCLTHIGRQASVSPEDVRSLTVGDRDALLLHLRRLTLGNRIQASMVCPREGCREKLDVELAVSDLLLPPNGNAKEFFETEVRDKKTTYKVKFRLPNGADQEEAARLALLDPEAGSKRILERCIRKVEKGKVSVKTNDRPLKTLAKHLPRLMAELDPQAEVLLNMTCPACEESFAINFDIGDYFFRELMSHSDSLYREVHILAFHYHWAEQEILNLSHVKRQIYLDLLSEALGPEES